MTTNIYTTYNVTAEQVEKAHRFINEQTHQVIYKVESQTTIGQEYTVFYNRTRKVLECNCPAVAGCWHKRAALADTALFKAEMIASNEATMIEFQAEIEAEAKHYGAYTVQVSETSSSLDGVTFEVAPSGRLVPMR